jgi:large subunit ribosomal protein L3
MSISLVGKKIGMTRIMGADGSATAVSVVQIQPNKVVQVKTVETDGYSALQLTTGKKVNKKGEAKTRRVSAALKGHYAKSEMEIGLGLWETRADETDLGTKEFGISMFGAGHFVDVSGTSKGKGFQGGVKRHNFHMQDATHGNSISHRALGSTGQCQEPGRVFKGKKMPGQMGNKQVTDECLEVIRVDNDDNLLLVKGAIPGANGGIVRVKLSEKKAKINNEISSKLQESQEVAETATEDNGE